MSKRNQNRWNTQKLAYRVSAAAFFTMAVDKRMEKMWFMQTIEYYWALKRDEVLTHATARMNLENLTLGPRSQSQKAGYSTMLLVWAVQIRPIYRDGKLISGCLELAVSGEKWGVAANRYGVSLGGHENPWMLFRVLAAQLCDNIKNHRTVHF